MFRKFCLHFRDGGFPIGKAATPFDRSVEFFIGVLPFRLQFHLGEAFQCVVAGSIRGGASSQQHSNGIEILSVDSMVEGGVAIGFGSPDRRDRLGARFPELQFGLPGRMIISGELKQVPVGLCHGRCGPSLLKRRRAG